MKRIYLRLLLAVVLLVFAGCDKNLEIAPTTSVNAAMAEQSFEQMIDGAYGLIGSGESTQGSTTLDDKGSLYSNDLIMFPDLLASENYVSWTGTFSQYRQIRNKTYNANNSVLLKTWSKAYKAINLANTILENVSKAPAEKHDYYKGQALFIRGIMYFELVRLYGEYPYVSDMNVARGVPVILKSTSTFEDITKPTRETVRKVYDQVLSDLITAKGFLPESVSDYANKYSVAGFLSRVYLTLEDYTNALNEVNQVIESGKYKLPFSVEAAFNTPSSPESVFQIIQTVTNNTGTENSGLTTFYACDPKTPGATGRGDLNINPLFAAKYDSTDKRRTVLIYSGTCSKGTLTSGKWKDPYQNIPVIRLSEIYLTRAECHFRLGTGDPLPDINLIRNKAGVNALLTVDLAAILLERELELAFEGHRIHDFRRTGKTTYVYTYKTDDEGKFILDENKNKIKDDSTFYDYRNDPSFVFPIPQNDINTNPNITQNEGY